MLSSRLFRVQLELQTHGAWLQSFRHGITAVATSAQCPLQRPAHAQFHATNPCCREDGAAPLSRPRIIYERKSRPKKSLPGPLSARFQVALANADYRVAIDCYNALEPKTKQALDDDILASLVRLISAQVAAQRKLRPQDQNRDAMEHAYAAAQTLAQDIQKRLLPNAKPAYPGLIAFFVENQQLDAGNRLWKWLRAQEDNELVSPSIYAAAIDLLAAQDTTLAELEDLYQEALQRFPDGFAAYHLSPGAVVPDRDVRQPAGTFSKAVLQSIMLARVRRGDSKAAYLALDTLLRLNPVVLPKSINGFMDERPLSEAWTAFMLACRGGIKLPHRELRTLITSFKSQVDPNSSEQMVWALQAVLTATYVFVGTGGILTRNMANEILIYTAQLMRHPAVGALPEEERRQLAEAVQDVLRQVIALFSRFNAMPSVPAFNSIITNVAGLGGLKPVIGTVWKDLASLELEPTMVTYRSVMTAAGMLKDVDLIKTSWASMVEARAAQDQYPDATDTHILAKACLLVGQPGFVEAALAEMSHLTEDEKERVFQRVDEGAYEPPAVAPSPDFTSNFLRQLDTLKQDIVQFENLTQDYPSILDLSTHFTSLPMSIVPPPDDVQLPEPEMRKLYDEMTTDPTSPPTLAAPSSSSESSSARHMSKTKIPFGTLRYENWKTLNNLLALAERNDRLYGEEVDRAIAARTSPPGRQQLRALFGDGKRMKVGLSELVEGRESGKVDEISGEEVKRRRGRIVALRTLVGA